MLPIIWLNEPASSPSWSLPHDVDAVGEIAVAHAFGAHEELVDRARNRAGQRQPHHQRHELDDQEQERDDGQDEQDGRPGDIPPTCADCASASFSQRPRSA